MNASGRPGIDDLAAAPVSEAPAPAAGPDGDLFDRVIRRVFAAGLLLNSAVGGSTPAGAASIEQATGELDEVVRDIRAAALLAVAPAPSAVLRTPSADARSHLRPELVADGSDNVA